VLGSGVGPLDWVATWKGVEGAEDLFVDLRSKHTGVALIVGEEVKDWAVSDQTTVVKASVSSLLKGRDVPSVDKITVVSVTGWVTHGEDEWLPSVLWNPPLKVGGVPDGLEEDGDQVDRVRGRAWAVVVRVHCWVSHVGLVWLVEVDTIPARWKEDLSTKTVRADLVRKLVEVWGGAAVVQANERNSLLREGVATSSEGRATSKHLEALWESLKWVVVWTTSLEVVDGHTSLRSLSITGLWNGNV